MFTLVSYKNPESEEIAIEGNVRLEPIPIIFEGFINGTKVFQMEPEQGSFKWGKILKACQEGTRYFINWKPNNGECYIVAGAGVVEFCLAKFGDGRGGNISITFPVSACIDAFKNAGQITLEWLTTQGKK